ncbi:group 1 truncated hemoglobin [Undibacterium jejuense]|uniref:Group 1 truncated hemoglobin n=1 Tax=Undibacterium jejuense TaxID=1344949 RepID=A0A923HMM1_9BURK|nr:group 1 truncated hemoglobin [Undibacterium jejuense]MBC3862401.1 group 1 truncated hemoglobin [Undibacterium jejuense]
MNIFPQTLVRIFLCLFLCLFISAIGISPQAQASTLYEDLGQDAGISRIVDETAQQILNDSRIKDGFKETNMKRLASLLKEQFCVLADGPCKYSGDDMKIVHEKLGITSAQFNALAEDLQIAMEKCEIPFSVQNKLIARLAPMKRDIVTVK